MRTQYDPATLPAVTTVEVVVLRGKWMVVHGRHKGKPLPTITVANPVAARLADLWRRLPPAEQSRCHSPPFGLRFFDGDHLICEASLCWECNNIHRSAAGEYAFYEFDGQAAVSQELLAALRELTGEAADG